MSTATPSLRERTGGLTSLAVFLWCMALLGTLGDYSITVWALQRPNVYESIWISRVALDVAGPLGLFLKEVLVTAGFGLVFVILPKPYRLAVPLGIAWSRWYLVYSNAVVLGVL